MENSSLPPVSISPFRYAIRAMGAGSLLARATAASSAWPTVATANGWRPAPPVPRATLRVWDTNTKAEHVVITAGPVHCIVFQPHGSLIATGSSNGALEFWQATEHGLRGRTVGPGPFGASLLGLAFSPDGRYIAAAGGNGLVSIYRVTAPPPTYRPGPVRTLPESKLLAEQAGLADQLKLADGFLSLPGKTPGTLVAVLGNGAFLHKLHGVNHPVQSVIYSDDGKFLASSCGRFEPSAGQFTAWEVTLWDAASGKPLRNFPGLADMVHALAFSPDSQRLVTGCRDGTVKVWRVDSAKELLNLQGHSAMIRSAAYSPDGKLIAGSSAGDGGKVILWDAKDGSKKFTFDQPAGGALHVAFSPDSRLLAAAMAQEVHIWETATGKEVAELKVNTRPRGVAFSHDNKRLVTVGEYPASQVWDLATQQLVFELKRHANFVLAVACSKDGAYFATGGSDQSVRLWDATNGKLLQTFFGHNGDVEGVAFHPDSKTLACGSGNGQVHVWDLATGKKLFPQHHSGPVLAPCRRRRWEVHCFIGGGRLHSDLGLGNRRPTPQLDRPPGACLDRCCQSRWSDAGIRRRRLDGAPLGPRRRQAITSACRT